jgi:hypothetical protein
MSNKHTKPLVAAPANTWTGQWLRRAHGTIDPAASNLITTMRSDANIPASFNNVEDMRAYVKRACPEAMAAVPIVWLRFRRWSNRNPVLPCHGSA